MAPNSSLSDAVELHQSGRLDAAARLYGEILAGDRENVDALHLLGTLHLQINEPDEAVRLISRAVELAPDSPTFQCNLGTALLELGAVDDAIGHYETALALAPDYLDAHYNLGNARRQKGDFGGAAADYARVIEMDPQHLPARNNYGICLLEADQLNSAIESLETTLRLAPDNRQTRQNLGIALQISGRPDEAAEQFETILSDDPTDSAALNGYAAVLVSALRLDEAEDAVAAARRQAPDDYETLINIGNLHQCRLRNGDAEAAYRQAIDLAPQAAAAWQNLAQLYAACGRHDEALETYDKALSLEPGHRRSVFGRAVCALRIGRFDEGWRDYRRRLQILARRDTLYGERLPADLDGMHLVVERDQGLGDEIFFLRFLAGLHERGARVTYKADPRLVPMIGRAKVAHKVIEFGDPDVSGDLTIAVGDLPYVLGMGDDDSPPPSILLPALPERTDALRATLETFGPPPYLGATWRAGTKGLYGSIFKQAPLEQFAAALLGFKGTIVALQRQPDAGEVEGLSALLDRPVLDLTPLNSDLEDMLTLVGLLDEYVCVSNTNVHLRAARGRTCHVLVPHPAEFRWMARGSESPWFPGSPVYRQADDGDWSGALSDLANALQSR